MFCIDKMKKKTKKEMENYLLERKYRREKLAEERQNEKKTNYKKIRGWLMFYVILLVLGLIIELSSISYTFLSITTTLFFDVFGIYCLILIFKLSPKAPKWNIIFLGVGIASLILYILLPLELGYNSSDIFFGIIYNIIFILYWKKSKRVKKTFGNNG